MPSKYPQELRDQILSEFSRGHSVDALAKDYELCEATILKWVDESPDRAARLNESDVEELRRLRKENKRLREDAIILEKAATWFATRRNGR